MNKILPLPDIAYRLAEQCGIDNATALEFVRNYFEVIAEGLAAGELVNAKGLGTFQYTAETDKVVKFTPAEDLKQSINAPFEAFSPLELPNNISEDELIGLTASVDVTVKNIAFNDNQSVSESNDEGPEPEDISSSMVEIEKQEPTITTRDEDNNNYHTPTADQTPTKDKVDEKLTEEPETEEVLSANNDDIGQHSLKTEYNPSLQDNPEQERKGREEMPNQEISHEDDHSTDDLNINKQSTDSKATIHIIDDDNEVYIVPSARYFYKMINAVWILVALLIGIIIGGICTYLGYDKLNQVFNNDSTEKYEIKQNISQPATDQQPTNTVEISQSGSPSINKAKPTQVEITRVEESKMHEETQAQPAETTTPQPIYDRITSKCFLTTMAGKYYGEKEFWVYIYKANSKKLRHPDRIKPGTVIWVPDKSTLPLTGNHQADVLKAKRLGQEIYAQYR